MWIKDFSIFVYAMYIQAIIVIIIVVATYFLYFIYKAKNRSKNKYVGQIKKYLLATYDAKQAVEKPLKRCWKKLAYLILAIKEADKIKEKNSKLWEQYKLEFAKKHMLPIARKYARKMSWFSRFLAANTFAIYTMPEDEKIIAQLIQDPKPAVTIECIHAIVHLPTELLLNTLIDKIATLRRKSYDLYLEPFKHLPESKREIIVKRLMVEKDPYKRDICYRILMFFAPEPLSDIARKDAKSKTIALCLSAIRFIAHSEGEKALPFLHQMLDDQRWQVKVVVLQVLSDLHDTSSVNVIEKLLDSPEWWVRINASNALKQIGKKVTKNE
jgi:hypothetical protein